MVRYDYQQIRQAQACLALSVLLGVCGLVWAACTASMGYGLLLPLLLCILPALLALMAALSNFQALYFGNRIRSEFRKCCLGTGLGEKFETHGVPEWKHYRLIDLFRADGLHHRDNVPSLRDLSGNFDQWSAHIVPLYGQTVDDFTSQAAAFELAHNLPFVAFERSKSGGIVMRAGQLLVPETYEYTPPLLLSDDARDRLQAVPMAQTIDGRTWSMPIEGQHLLVAGRTGSGKSSWIWSLVFGLEPAINAGVCRIWGLDPKRVELAIGKHWFYKYANDPAGMVGLIEEFLHEMQARTDVMHGVSRKFTPSPDTPLNILLIDELAYITALLPDKKLRDRGMAALTTILNQGRAIGFSALGALQDPRKEALPNRDGFTIRVALGLPEKQLIDMVLGDGAHDKSALCEQIPLGAAGAGVGYVISEESNQPLCVRAAWCSDEAIKRKLGAPAEALLETPPLAYPAYEQGYPPQLGFDGQPLDQSFYHDGE